MHTTKKIDEDTNKSDSVLFYNETKGGVDTVDHLIESFSCRRKTYRWTFNILMSSSPFSDPLSAVSPWVDRIHSELRA